MDQRVILLGSIAASAGLASGSRLGAASLLDPYTAGNFAGLLTLGALALLRDELANLGWAVERVAPDAAGAPVDHRELLPPPDPGKRPDLPRAAQDERPPPALAPADAAAAELVPLIPEARAERLAGFVLGSVHSAAPVPDPGGVLLAELPNGGLGEEELGREGRRLTRAPQLALWSDGSRHEWIARAVSPGTGEGSSGLRFDTILPEL